MEILHSPLSDDDLLRLSARLALEGWQLEYVHGKVVVSPPTGGETGSRNFNLYGPLAEFANRHGYVGYDSSTGFRLSDGDVRSPDAALIAQQRVARLTPQERKQFPPLAPDIVVELLSETDDLAELVKKCKRWRDEGSSFVVLLDPQMERRLTWGEAPEGFPELTAW